MNKQSPLLALAPTLCAVHCLAAPIVTVAAPMLGENPAIEWGALAFSLAVAAYTFRGSERRLATMLAGAGFLVWLLALTVLGHSAAHTPVLVLGSVTVAFAMLGELRARARAHDCHCHACVSSSTEIAPGERTALS